MSLVLLFAAGCVASIDESPPDPVPATVPTPDPGPTPQPEPPTPEPEPDPDPIDSGTAAGMVGTLPADALPLPSFAATNFDGTSRGPDALQGHLTVMWFLPAANTGG